MIARIWRLAAWAVLAILFAGALWTGHRAARTPWNWRRGGGGEP